MGNSPIDSIIDGKGLAGNMAIRMPPRNNVNNILIIVSTIVPLIIKSPLYKITSNKDKTKYK